MKILERYNTAIHASNLKPDNNTIHADLDVIGAAGLAARYEPMGIALARMLAGGGQGDVIAVMAEAAYSYSQKIKGGRVTRLQAEDISKAVLAWFRDGRCDPCKGTTFQIIPGTPSLGHACPACKGTGKLLFEKQFRQDWQQLAVWLQKEVQRSQANAGVIAMRKIAPTLDF